MDAWLRTERDSKDASSGFRLVHNPLYATPMIESAAREAMNGAKRECAVVRENDVAAVFTNLPPILKNFHRPESLP